MTRQIIFDLSKEHPVLARDEILACLHAENYQFQITISNDNVLVITSNINEENIYHLSQRLSLSFSIGELLYACKPVVSEIRKHAHHYPFEKKGSLAVRHKNRSSLLSKPLVHAVADVYTKSRRVDLTNPDHTIFLLITDKTVFVSYQLIQINRGLFEQRKAHLRPFFSPISLHPKIARALVNISQVKSNQTLLDPFCGTGGILIEAGLLNVNIIGSDLSAKMVRGAKENLDYYSIKPINMVTCDIESLSNNIHEKVDAVVTDFPYGKATSTNGEHLSLLYQRAINSIQHILKSDGRAVLGTPSKQLGLTNTTHMIHIISYPFRVHRSLTRWFHVFKRKP